MVERKVMSLAYNMAWTKDYMSAETTAESLVDLKVVCLD